MNASARSDILTRTQQLEDHRENPSADDAPQLVCVDEPSRLPGAEGPGASDEGDFPSFIDGAGI
jgi:hypothetical protein